MTASAAVVPGAWLLAYACVRTPTIAGRFTVLMTVAAWIISAIVLGFHL